MKEEEEEEELFWEPFWNKFGIIFRIWWQMGLKGIRQESASKQTCFIDQSGRDLLFYLDETRMRVTKYRKTHEKRA